MSTWNTNTELYVEVAIDPDSDWATPQGRIAPAGLKNWLQEKCNDADGEFTSTELAITVNASGYESPGTMYARNGDPGDPPEYDEERCVTSVETVDGEALPKSLLSEIELWLHNEIEELTFEEHSA